MSILTALVLASACGAAEWIGSAEGPDRLKGAAYARGRLTVSGGAIRKATLRVASPCFCEPWLDGRQVTPRRILTPAVTDFVLHAHEDVYDVTDRLTAGRHCLGLWLAPGYSSDIRKHGFRWLGPKCVRATVEIDYADGARQVWGTDETWQYREDSPVTFASVYHGEEYDARRAVPDWCRVDGSDAGWQMARKAARIPPAVVESRIPPVVLCEPRRPLSVRRLPGGAFVVDFGVNRAGVVELCARGARGRVIRIRTAEELKADGSLDAKTNGDARSTDVWTLAGTGGVETYRPRFTYHGFRYAEITNYPGEPGADDVIGWAVKSEFRRIGSFRSSDDGLNWLMAAAIRSLESNLLAIPTDCCQRNERAPCLPDVQASMDIACKIFDMRDFYGTLIDNIPPERTVVLPDPKNYEPGAWIPQRINPDWNGLVIALPWTLWREYADRAALERAYPAMKRMMEIFLRQYPDFICTHGYGDWNPPNAGKPKQFFSHVTFVESAWLVRHLETMAKSAAALGCAEDAARYRQLHAEGVEAFNARFLDAKAGVYGTGSQIEYIAPLAWGLVPERQRATVAGNFLRTIRDRDDGKINFGAYVGVPKFGGVMCDLGEVDLALEMLMRPEYPSFGFMRRKGATSIWEQWAYAGPMHSHNHMFMASVTDFLFTHLAGIRPKAPGYAEVEIDPVVPRSVDFIGASIATPHGSVSSAWHWRNGLVDYDINIPKGMRATFRGRPLKEGRNCFSAKYP